MGYDSHQQGDSMYELIFHPDAESEIYDLEPAMQAKALKGLEKL